MKIGIFSDIHGNLEALTQVLAFLRNSGATIFICCGDIVGYGPDPHACIERIRNLRGPVVAGNHDYGVLGRVPAGNFNPAARIALAWTKEQLDEKDLNYLDSLPLIEQFEPLCFVHAAPSAPEQWEYIFAVREAEDEMKYFASNACIVGHTHYPFVVERRAHEPAKLIRQDSFEMRADAKYVVNVGSVGQPRDGDPAACCVLYDTGTKFISFHRVKYNVRTVQEKILRAGLPEFFANRLALGH
ncbi:hypothetical protein CH330_05475 [candidate division WOR-3 bacterium JGI_Cruoil_03_51_56]|uniref:Calcineurin-like phosphoesterase domain-containing protein n=1 Tax=candidate division WOR-3 bacterium JGI_Cruoil_03_51_56 TaxID=1973747 RepID=A0A235BTL8_UNCW3|nr:MAG: hypothetical protein CH330_05475 [candidate division WOR-3 bacterium JGI_Cruoil_03_51_56]